MITQQSKRGIVSVQANGTPENIMGQLNAAFEDFKQKHNGEVSEIKSELSGMSADFAAFRVMGGGSTDGINPERKNNAFSAVTEFMRTGSVSAMNALIPRAEMSTDNDPAGGYMVPKEIDTVIQSQMISISPMRRLANVVRVGSSDYRKLINRRGASSGWVGEREARGETDTPLLGEINPPMGELYAQPEITNWMAEDSQFDLEAFIKENVSDEFAFQEGAGFTSGDSMDKPAGFLSYPTSTDVDGTRDFGTLQYVVSGAASNFAASDPGDALLNLVYAVQAGYRAGPNVGWQMNSATLNLIRQFKDGQGNYLWQKAQVAGQPATLCGYPIYECEDMPDVGANAFPVAFGNWHRGYIIVDRSEVKLLRDPYTKKGWIKFYFTKRVGGAVADSRAIKLLKISV